MAWSNITIPAWLRLSSALLLLTSCKTLPPTPELPRASFSLPAASTGPLAETTRTVRSTRGGNDALLMLETAHAGLEWRLALIDSAKESIDLQYFTWNGDAAGHLVLHHLLAAADRGVRVRLLLDDLYLVSKYAFSAPDKGLATIDAHPNLEIRIFNPGKYRSGNMGVAGNYAGNFDEFNRRMHNKLLIADGHLAILGGRNIANEYYGLHETFNFLDLDVLVIGPVTGRMGTAFDTYWNADPAFPAASFSVQTTQSDMREAQREIAELVTADADKLQAFALQPQDWSALLSTLPAQMLDAKTAYLQDQPEVRDMPNYRLINMVSDLSKDSKHESIIVTPYLIPVGDFLEQLTELVARGVHVRVLTASLASGNHSAVHAHYKKYRRDILATGVELYESRHQPSATLRALADQPPVTGEFVSLHTKVAVSDRQNCFVGSLNLDPRALVHNTENGMVIYSNSFCGQLADLLELYLQPENAWRVSVDEKDKLQWTSSEGTVYSAPARSFGQGVADFIFRWMPLENQL